MAAIAMRMVVLIGPVDSCFFLVVRLDDSLRLPIGILPDLCMIIGCAMYTDDQSGINNPNVFGSWPPYRWVFDFFCQIYSWASHKVPWKLGSRV